MSLIVEIEVPGLTETIFLSLGGAPVQRDARSLTPEDLALLRPMTTADRIAVLQARLLFDATGRITTAESREDAPERAGAPLEGRAVKVTLSPQEMERARLAGEQRHREQWRKGAKGNDGRKDDAEELARRHHVLGARGELAYAKADQRSWNGKGSVGMPDVGLQIDVRTVSRPGSPLVHQKQSTPERFFVLVEGSYEGDEFTVVGWMRGQDCRTPAWWKAQGPPWHPAAAWFVPQAELKSFPLPVNRAGGW